MSRGFWSETYLCLQVPLCFQHRQEWVRGVLLLFDVCPDSVGPVVVLNLVFVVLCGFPGVLLILLDVWLSLQSWWLLILNVHRIGFLYLIADVLCFFISGRIVFVIRSGGVLTRAWHTLLNWWFNESLLSWAKHSSFRCYFSLKFCGQWSCLILTRTWSEIIKRLSLKPSSTGSESSLNSCIWPSFILEHQIWNLVTSRPYVCYGIFIRVSVPLSEPLNFWPKILQPLWDFSCLKTCILLVIIISTRSWTVEIIVIFKNINILLGFERVADVICGSSRPSWNQRIRLDAFPT